MLWPVICRGWIVDKMIRIPSKIKWDIIREFGECLSIT
jgi:hypothetical protein